MSGARWLEISLNIPAEALEAVSAQLIANGVPGLLVEEEEEFLRFLEENRQYWDYVDDELLKRMQGLSRIKLYVTDDADGASQLARYLDGVDYPYETLPLLEDDWAYSWQKYYRPMAVGARLYIVPDWERDAAVPAGRTALRLNPGLSFGTGSHASTRLCLEALEDCVASGGRVLDLGCGSGILSIAALLLGASEALAVDIDPKAAEVSRENAALNDLGPARYQARAGDLLTDETLMSELSETGCQLVLANIVADVIMALSPRVPRLLARDGFFICSGIIEERAAEVRAKLTRDGLAIVETREETGWVCLVCRLAGGDS